MNLSVKLYAGVEALIDKNQLIIWKDRRVYLKSMQYHLFAKFLMQLLYR